MEPEKREEKSKEACLADWIPDFSVLQRCPFSLLSGTSFFKHWVSCATLDQIYILVCCIRAFLFQKVEPSLFAEAAFYLQSESLPLE
jgi:hypothetical protein